MKGQYRLEVSKLRPCKSWGVSPIRGPGRWWRRPRLSCTQEGPPLRHDKDGLRPIFPSSGRWWRCWGPTTRRNRRQQYPQDGGRGEVGTQVVYTGYFAPLEVLKDVNLTSQKEHLHHSVVSSQNIWFTPSWKKKTFSRVYMIFFLGKKNIFQYIWFSPFWKKFFPVYMIFWIFFFQYTVYT